MKLSLLLWRPHNENSALTHQYKLFLRKTKKLKSVAKRQMSKENKLFSNNNIKVKDWGHTGGSVG